METQTVTTIQQVATGATLGGGAPVVMTWMGWVTLNASALTALAFCATAVVSIVLGVWNAYSKNKNDKVVNRMNKRTIEGDIVDELLQSGKSKEYVEDFRKSLKM